MLRSIELPTRGCFAFRTTLLVSALLVLALIGCGQSAKEATPPATDNQSVGSDELDHELDHEADQSDAGAAGQETAGPDTALSQLSAEDRQLAEQQGICPVSGEPLGSMGSPVKLTVEGREVFICCTACEDAIREDPEKYFAKIDQPDN